MYQIADNLMHIDDLCDTTTMMSPGMQFKIEYRTLSDLCGRFLLHQFNGNTEAIKPLLPELEFTRISEMQHLCQQRLPLYELY